MSTEDQMNPDNDLDRQLELARLILEGDTDIGSRAVRLAELVLRMHENIIRGFPLPRRWNRERLV